MNTSGELMVNEVPPAMVEAEVTRGIELKTVFLGGIFLILLLASMRYASEIFMPIVLAFVLKLILQPVLRGLEKIRIPRRLAALMVILMLLGSGGMLVTALSGPAASWAETISDTFPQLQERLSFLKKPVQQTQTILGKAEDLTKGTGPKTIAITMPGSRLSDRLISSTQAFASGFFTTLVMLFFLLAAGDTFLRRLVEVLPRFKDKRQAVDISQHIEHDISSYLLTISVVNAAEGIAVGLVMWACGVADPALWGVLAFLLNYVPILGPFLGVVLFALAGLMTIHEPGMALLPAALYFLIHVIEANFITPLLLAKRFTLNPVLVMFSLIFWYWMWGFTGAILAVPMLAISKIICDRIESLQGFGHFLEG